MGTTKQSRHADTPPWHRATPYILIVTVVAGSAIAAWSSVATAPSPTAPRAWLGFAPPKKTTVVSDPHQGAATREAQHLMTLVQPAPGWTPVAAPPTRELREPGAAPASEDLVDLYQLWRAHGPLPAVQSWIAAHPPTGSRPAGTGSSFDRTLVETSVTDAYPAIGDEFQSRQLVVAIAPVPGGGVGVRVDAQVIWYPSRPASETIPRGATRVTAIVFTQGVAGRSLQAVLRLRAFTSLPVVRFLARFVDSVPLAVPGPRSCPADTGSDPQLELVFSGRPGVPMVEVHDDPNGCGAVSFSIDGRDKAPLTDSGLFRRVDQLLGPDRAESGQL